MSSIFVGISGWNFEDWRGGTFYPEGLKHDQELAYASRKLRSIEINGTFYSLFRPTSYLSWYDQSPADFCFAIKGPKYITHERRLKDFETPLANLMASGILALREKLGPILWQFPPNMKFDAERFEPFMQALPHDMKTALRVASGHSDWMKERLYLEVDKNHRMRHAIEARNESFRCPAFVNLCRRYGVAIVVADTEGRWPLMEDVTTDFLYLRLHADESKYPEGYDQSALERWAERIELWTKGGQPADARVVIPGAIEPRERTIFNYFDNDNKETAPLNALSMISLLVQKKLLKVREFADLPVATAKKSAKSKAVTGSQTKSVAKAAKKITTKKKEMKKVGTTKKKVTKKVSTKKAG